MFPHGFQGPASHKRPMCHSFSFWPWPPSKIWAHSSCNLYLLFTFVCCSSYLSMSKARVYFSFQIIVRLPGDPGQTQGRNWSRKHRGGLLTGLLHLSQASFLDSPGPAACLVVAPSRAEWTSLNHSAVKKTVPAHAHKLIWQSQYFYWGTFFRRCVIPVTLPLENSSVISEWFFDSSFS